MVERESSNKTKNKKESKVINKLDTLGFWSEMLLAVILALSRVVGIFGISWIGGGISLIGIHISRMELLIPIIVMAILLISFGFTLRGDWSRAKRYIPWMIIYLACVVS